MWLVLVVRKDVVLQASMNCQAQLSAVLTKADGTKSDLGILADDSKWFSYLVKFRAMLSKMFGPVVAVLMIVSLVKTGHLPLVVLPMMGLITDAGLTFLAVAFTVDAAGTDIFNMQWHDSGTGTNAEVQTDTTLQTPTGIARVSGVNTKTQDASGTGSTTPAKVQSQATIAYNNTFAITEWGLFSASSSGSMWDRRKFAAINVVSGDSIQFTYSLSIPGGGT